MNKKEYVDFIHSLKYELITFKSFAPTIEDEDIYYTHKE